jgi:alpha-L-rhamnosidase
VEDFKTVLGVERTVPQHYPEGLCPEKDPRSPSNIACGKRLCGQARPDWGMAVVLMPWFNWLYYGDRETVIDAWPMMTDYMEFLAEIEVDNHLIKKGYAYGDWCPPGGKNMIDTPPQMSASVLYYRSNLLMAHMAKLLGKRAEVKNYLERAERVKDAVNRTFFDAEHNHYGSQTGTAMALNAGLVPEGKEAAAAAGLNDLIMEKSGGAYTTGIMGHRHLYTALNDHGFEATTAALWQKTDFPSLAYMTEKHDLTTWPEVNSLWEEGKRYSGSSFNHPMQSGFAVAFHESICGIRSDPEHPGFEKFILKPCFLPGLDWAKAEVESPKGKISSHWKRNGDVVVWTVSVPNGSSARIALPAGVLVNGKAISADGLQLSGGNWNMEVSRSR